MSHFNLDLDDSHHLVFTTSNLDPKDPIHIDSLSSFLTLKDWETLDCTLTFY